MTHEVEATRTLTIHLPLSRPLEAEPASALIAALAALDGVVACELDRPRTGLRIRYEVTRTGLDAILQVLDRFGVASAPGLTQRMRLGLYRYREENARDNARTPAPACCNRPPEAPTKPSSENRP